VFKRIFNVLTQKSVKERNLVERTDSTRTYPAVSHKALMRRVSWRLLPLLFIMFVISYLDRVNTGFAAVTMNRELALSATAFGLAGTIMYFGYAVCEVPSTLLMVRFGARRWLARIMITWGLASAATMFAFDAHSLYGIRLLVGIAEAGFAPGALLYLTYWFPKEYIGRANALFLVGGPVAMAIGAALSGFILQHGDGLFGLSGWRVMFLVEGLPAVLLGVTALLWFADKPEKAKWLSAEEASTLQKMLNDPVAPQSHTPVKSVVKQLANRNVLFLSICYFCLCNSFTANSMWTPSIMRGILPGHSLTFVGLITSVPAICAIILMPLWSMSSDRNKERHWHLVIALAMTLLGWLLMNWTSEPLIQVIGVICTTAGAFSAMSVFWTLPQRTLPNASRPAGLALINAVGILGSVCSPTIIGLLRDTTKSFSSGLYFSAALLAVAIVAVPLSSTRSSNRNVRSDADVGEQASAKSS